MCKYQWEHGCTLCRVHISPAKVEVNTIGQLAKSEHAHLEDDMLLLFPTTEVCAVTRQMSCDEVDVAMQAAMQDDEENNLRQEKGVLLLYST